TTQAYGTDADPEVIAETQKDPYVPTGTFTLANYKDPQPEHVKNCDLIVGHALPIFAVDVIKPENIEKAIINLLAALKSGGELRFSPFFISPPGRSVTLLHEFSVVKEICQRLNVPFDFRLVQADMPTSAPDVRADLYVLLITKPQSRLNP